MTDILYFDMGNEQLVILVCLCLAVFRIYLELININLAELPISKMMGKEKAQTFHKAGLILSIGYVILFAPGFLLS
jgi:hypothetical protein